MSFPQYKKEDFFMTGSVQTAHIYFYEAAAGAKFSGNGYAVIIFLNGVVYTFFAKEAIKRLKDELAQENFDSIKIRYKNWGEKWYGYENELYLLATNPESDWRKNWQRLDEISFKFWGESYCFEAFDHYAEEFEMQIKSALEKINENVDLRGELVLPIEPTKVQMVGIDREKIKTNELSKEEFLRRYWYCYGSWNGGELLTKELLDRDLLEKDVAVDFIARAKMQAKIDGELNPEILDLVKKLRLFALWRDERKIFVQMINLGYVRVLQDAGKELKFDPKIGAWSRREEIDEVVKNPEKFLDRKKQSILIYDQGEKPVRILVGKETEDLIKEFISFEEKKELRGIVAAPGKVSGKVNVVLRQHQFFEFTEGDVLVTSMTRPEFLPLMKRASAIITDEGGLTCHAAIISRELKKPCIVGTKEATHIFKTGDLVEVDADKGIIKKI